MERGPSIDEPRFIRIRGRRGCHIYAAGGRSASLPPVMSVSDANIVYSFFQDEQGMMWLGTKRGLFSYDGYSLQRHASGEYGTDDNSIQTMVQLERGILCLGTDVGLSWFDLEHERCIPLPEALHRIGAVRSLVLFAGEEGILYAVTYHGLARIRTEAMQASYYHYLFPERMFFCNHALWYNVRDTLFCLGSDASLPEVYPLSGETGQIYGFGSDGGSSVCFSSTAGIFRIDFRTKECTNLYPSDHYFRASLFDRSREMMLWGGEDCLLCLPANPEKRPTSSPMPSSMCLPRVAVSRCRCVRRARRLSSRWPTTFARIGYNYDGRYLFEFNVRHDGSSRMPKSHRYATFPSLSAGWVLTNEAFMQDVEPLRDDHRHGHQLRCRLLAQPHQRDVRLVQ